MDIIVCHAQCTKIVISAQRCPGCDLVIMGPEAYFAKRCVFLDSKEMRLFGQRRDVSFRTAKRCVFSDSEEMCLFGQRRDVSFRTAKRCVFSDRVTRLASAEM